jgi:O-methyltransferase involved in polyketide biosynthesis
MYNYYLGGKDNFAADRAAADKAIEAFPSIAIAARENRAFIRRAVTYVSSEAGVHQFLDIGSGLPTAGAVHEVAQGINPGARVVYVDNDPLVLAHARALLTSTPEGHCAYIHADLREPRKILGDQAARETLDFSRPVALILAAVLHFLSDEDDPARIVATLMDALPSGSYLIASHGSPEYVPDEVGQGITRAYTTGGMNVTVRDHSQFADIAFRGLELVPPGLLVISEWHPEPAVGPRPQPWEVSVNGAVARKP